MIVGLALLVCALALTPEAFGQPTPTTTGKAETKSSTRRIVRPRPRPVIAASASASPASVQSYEFLTLGDRFDEKEKWNAAEAAYKEAVTVLPGNGDALIALGYLYLDRTDLDSNKKLEKARAIHTKLRSVDSSLASTLLTEINKFQAQLAH